MEKVDSKVWHYDWYYDIEQSIKSEVRHIIDLHLKCNISKKGLASMIGVSQPTITQWYYGVKIPSTKHYCALKSGKLALILIFGLKSEE